uniref:Uncharacterized protein n=1 Tax=Romanomermis culicivorax TaxID=13658 RepID=A0A915HKC4_ROMCU
MAGASSSHPKSPTTPSAFVLYSGLHRIAAPLIQLLPPESLAKKLQNELETKILKKTKKILGGFDPKTDVKVSHKF